MATFDEAFKLLKSSRMIRADPDDEDNDAPANVIEMEDKMEYSINFDPPLDALTESEEEEMDDDSEYVPESSDLESSDEDSCRLPGIYPLPTAKLKWTSDMKAGVPSTLPAAASASVPATATSPTAATASVSATVTSPSAASASASATATSQSAATASVSATATSQSAATASVSATATSQSAATASVSATATSQSAATASVSATAMSPSAASASVSATATSQSAATASVSATATSPSAATASVLATSNLAASSCRSGKPKRPCLYCGSFESYLKRHLKRKHSDEDQVQAALKLPPHQQAKAFDSIRKAGILNRNKELLGQGIGPEQLIRERRQGNSKVVLCGGCNGFFSKKLIKKHKQKYCSRNESLQAETIDNLQTC